GFARATRGGARRWSRRRRSTRPPRETAMSAADLCWLGIGELGRRYRAREVSPVDVATAHLSAIEKQDKTLNSYVTVTADRALAEAPPAETPIRAGHARPLTGIPIADKDRYAAPGRP